MIVIPMAGMSRRFTEAGYALPKYMLEARGRTLFRHAVESFRHCFDEERFVFVFRDVAATGEFIRAELQAMGLAGDRVALVALDAPTAGQAETVAIALRRIGADPDEDLTIFNIDTIRPGFVHPLAVDRGRVDGYLEVFRGAGDHWSFVRGAARDDRTGRALEVAEKRRIGDLCSTGLYWFRRIGTFLHLYAESEGTEAARLQGGERHVAPLFQRAIERGMAVDYALIDAAGVAFSGTPAEYEAFRRRVPTDATTALCISGQMRGGEAHYAALAEAAERLEADVYISTWRRSGAKSFDGGTRMTQFDRVTGADFREMLPHRLKSEAADVFPRLNAQIKAATGEDVGPALHRLFPDAMIDVEDETFDLSFDHEDRNSLRMLYKIWRCTQMRRRGEKLRGRPYDRVIRLRPDLLPNVPVVSRLPAGDGTVHILVTARGQVNDMIWLTDSATDSRIATLFHKAISPDRAWRGIHPELAAHLRECGAEIRHARLKGGDLATPPVPGVRRQLVRDLAAGACRSDETDGATARALAKILAQVEPGPATGLDAATLAALGDPAPEVVSAALVAELCVPGRSGRHAAQAAVIRSAIVFASPAAIRESAARHHWRALFGPVVWGALAAIDDLPPGEEAVIAPDAPPVLGWALAALARQPDLPDPAARLAETAEALRGIALLLPRRLERLIAVGRMEEARRLAGDSDAGDGAAIRTFARLARKAGRGAPA